MVRAAGVTVVATRNTNADTVPYTGELKENNANERHCYAGLQNKKIHDRTGKKRKRATIMIGGKDA